MPATHKAWICESYDISAPLDILAEKARVRNLIASPIHDADRKKDGTYKKPHRHIVFALSNRVGLTRARAIAEALGAANAYCEPCDDVVAYVSYMTHETAAARKEGKTVYPREYITSGPDSLAIVAEAAALLDSSPSAARRKINARALCAFISDKCPATLVDAIELALADGDDALADYILNHSNNVSNLISSYIFRARAQEARADAEIWDDYAEELAAGRSRASRGPLPVLESALDSGRLVL